MKGFVTEISILEYSNDLVPCEIVFYFEEVLVFLFLYNFFSPQLNGGFNREMIRIPFSLDGWSIGDYTIGRNIVQLISWP